MTHNNECPNGTPTTDCDIYDVCESRICAMENKCNPLHHTVDELVDEHNLMVARIDNKLTVCIAHDGSINDIHALVDNIRDMVCRFRLGDVVTCITLVIAPFNPYRVEPVTLSGTVWNINCQSVPQIKMALNQIALRINR